MKTSNKFLVLGVLYTLISMCGIYGLNWITYITIPIAVGCYLITFSSEYHLQLIRLYKLIRDVRFWSENDTD